MDFCAVFFFYLPLRYQMQYNITEDTLSFDSLVQPCGILHHMTTLALCSNITSTMLKLITMTRWMDGWMDRYRQTLLVLMNQQIMRHS